MSALHAVTSTPIFPNARTIEHPGGSTGVLLLHGWTGYTGRLAPLGERLAKAGFSVRIPRLPGHGTSVEDLLSCTWRDWWRRAQDEYLDYSARHETVLVAGASMGAVLAAMLAASFAIERVALLAPALLVRNPLLPLTPLLQYIVPKVPCDWSAETDPDPEAGPICSAYKSHNYLSSLAQLYHLGRQGRRVLPRVTADILVIVSEQDDAVPSRVAPYVSSRATRARVEQMVLGKSGHQLVQGVEGDAVCRAVVEWFMPRR